MAHFYIHHIGPIEDVTFTLNRINVFIGPQSCGKSTIAKIVSFCSWMEKDALLRQSTAHIDMEYVERELLKYHKMQNYLCTDSVIEYKGQAIDFRYKDGTVEATKNKSFSSGKVSKTAYIPSERNVVALPGISSLPFSHTNLRDFVFDWLSIHNKYTKENPVQLLDLNLNYYFQESTGRDMLVLEDGKELQLEESSSGMQSVVPLYVYLHYLSDWIYRMPEDISFEKKELLRTVIHKELQKMMIPQNAAEEEFIHAMGTPKFRPIMDEMWEHLHPIGNKKVLKDTGVKRIMQLENNLRFPHFSNIVLEEPEQNLFPQTQVSLTYDILRIIDTERDNLLITTHSPYILYALNNCMLGWTVKDNIPEEDTEARRTALSWTNPKNVSVWELRDGKFSCTMQNEQCTIQDERGLIRGNYFDRIMKNVMADFSTLINYTDDE